MIKNAYHCICDFCGDEIIIVVDNLRECRQELRANGWIPTKRRKCYCSTLCHLNAFKEEVGYDI